MEVNETNRPLTEVPAENAPETSVPIVEQTEKPAYALRQTQEEVVARLTEINKDACNADKQEIDYLKQTFYKLHKAEQDAARKAFIDGGGNPDDFVPAPDPWETRFKEIGTGKRGKLAEKACHSRQNENVNRNDRRHEQDLQRV